MTTRPVEKPFDPQATTKARQVEILISSLLRIGVTVSLIVVLCGLALSFAHHHEYLRSRGALTEVTGAARDFPHTVSGAWDGVLHERGEGMVVLGLLLLIATPVMRVAVSIFAFVYERDLVFIAITSFVLTLLILSFFLGKVE